MYFSDNRHVFGQYIVHVIGHTPDIADKQ